MFNSLQSIKEITPPEHVQKAGKKLVDFVAHLNEDEELNKTGEDVKTFARGFSIPGV